MTKYRGSSTCKGGDFTPVEADNVQEAAEVFANRAARREYGRRGYTRTLRPDSHTTDGRSHTYEAFIGYDVREHGSTSCSGHNVWIYVNRA